MLSALEGCVTIFTSGGEPLPLAPITRISHAALKPPDKGWQCATDALADVVAVVLLVALLVVLPDVLPDVSPDALTDADGCVVALLDWATAAGTTMKGTAARTAMRAQGQVRNRLMLISWS